jgi:hypothetical protein
VKLTCRTWVPPKFLGRWPITMFRCADSLADWIIRLSIAIVFKPCSISLSRRLSLHERDVLDLWGIAG